MGVQFFVNGVVFASFIPRLPEIRDRIGADLGTVGIILTLAVFGGLAASSLCSTVISRFGTRQVLIVGASCLIIVLPFIGAASAPWMLWVGLALLQFFDVFVDVAMNMQGSWISARRRVPVMNRLHGLWSLGTVIGGGLSALLAGSSLSLQTHLIGVAVVLLLTLIFVARGLLAEDEEHEAETPAVDDTGGVREAPVSQVRRILFFLGVMGAAAMAIEMVSGDWAAFRMADDLGASESLAGVGFVAFTSGMVIGRFAGDSIEARIGSFRLFQAAAVVSGSGVALATLIPNTLATLVGFVLAGVGTSVLFPFLYDQAAKAPGKPGAGLGVLTAGSRLGLLGAPVLVGTLANTDSLSVGQAMAIVILPMAIAIVALNRSAFSS